MISPYRLAGEVPPAPKPAKVIQVDVEDDVEGAVACRLVEDGEVERPRDAFMESLLMALMMAFGIPRNRHADQRALPMTSTPYRVLAERPPADALRVLPVLEVRPPLVLSGTASFDDEDFATVRYVPDDETPGHPIFPREPNKLPLWFYLVAGFTVSFGGVAAWAMFGGG